MRANGFVRTAPTPTMRPVVIDPLKDSVRADLLRAVHPGLPVIEPPDVGAVPGAIADADGPVALVCANSTWQDAYLAPLDAGDWVATITTGHEHFPIEAFAERGIIFTNTPGLTTEPIAEHAFGLAFTCSRRLWTYRDQSVDGVWEIRGGMTDFAGDTCCVVGIGRIGEAVAVRARAFGMRVRGVKRSVEGYDGAAHEVYPSEELRDALADVRLVVICVPLTDETRGLLSTEELAACADDAVVINVSRGPVLDEAALLDALDAGELSGAGLDVFETEPLPEDSVLWDHEAVVVTPHCAGRSTKTADRLIGRLLKQYDRWAGGDELDHRIV